MSADARFEQLAVAALDFGLSPPEQGALDAHLAVCPACRALSQAYRADSMVLQTIALAPSPPRVRAAVLEAAARPVPRRPAWQLLGIAALITLMLAGLAVTAGALVDRLRPDSVIPVEPPSWMGTDEWRIGAVVGLDQGWLVGATGIGGTRLQTYHPAAGWQSEGSEALLEFILLADIEPLPDGGLLVVGVVQGQKGVVLRRHQGAWSRTDDLDTLHIQDAAVQNDRIWLLASTAYAPDAGTARLALGSTYGKFATFPIDIDVAPDRAHIAVGNDRLAIAGCAATGETCELTFASASRDGTGWAPARIPQGGDPGEPQILGVSGGFLALVPGQGDGAEIWESRDGRVWDVAATFALGASPDRLIAGISGPLAIGVADGQIVLWAPDGARGWVDQPTGIAADEVLAAGARATRVLVIGTSGGEIRGWNMEVDGR